MVGEGPGASEDVLGAPFCGPAGIHLDAIIKDALHGLEWEPRLGFTNLIGCIPYDEEGKVTEPPKPAVKACAPRLVEIVRMCKPRMIVLVGKQAAKYISGQAQFNVPTDKKYGSYGSQQLPWLDKRNMLEFIQIDHPAFILRADASQQELLNQRCTIVLTDAFQMLSPSNA